MQQDLGIVRNLLAKTLLSMAHQGGSAAQLDGTAGHNEHRDIKERIEHPFPELREKLKQTKLYDLKV